MTTQLCVGRSLSLWLVALLEIRLSSIVKMENAKAGEPKFGEVFCVLSASLTFSHTFSHQRDTRGTGEAMQDLPWEALHCLHPVQIFTIWLLPLPQVSIPAAAWGRWVRGTEVTPWACPGKLGWGHRAGCSLLSDSPSWWVAKLLSQWFPVKSLHQEAPHLGSLEKNLPLQEIAS